MAWILDPSIGKRLRSSISTLEKMRRSTCVLRASLEPNSFQRFMTDTLLLQEQDMVDAEGLAARICDTLSMACMMPDEIVAQNRFEMNVMNVALSQHMGVDPIRLLLAAFDAKARAIEGERSVEITLKRSWGKRRKAGKPDQLDMRIMLAKDVMLRGSRITARRTQLPEAVINTLPGRRLDDIIQFPWEGWKDIGIVGAARRGDSLIIDTDARDVITNFEFEDEAKSR